MTVVLATLMPNKCLNPDAAFGAAGYAPYVDMRWPVNPRSF